MWVSVIAGLALRLYHLSYNSIWSDEGFSVASGNATVPQVIHEILTVEPHPPTYYLILHYWIDAFGASPAAIRAPSVIFGVGAIFVVYKIGATLSDRRLGGVSSFLMAISPVQIQYGTEARMYSLLTFAAALGIWGAALFMRNMTSVAILRRASVILVVGISLAIASYDTGVLVWTAISVTLFIIWLLNGRPAPALRYGLIFNGIIAILFLFWLPFLLEQWQIAQTATNWMPPLSAKVVAEALGPLFAPKIEQALSYRAAAFVAAVVVLIALLGAFCWRHDRRAIVFCVLIGTIPVASAAAISLVKPIFVTNILLPPLIPLYLLIATAIIACRPRFVQGGVIAVVVLVNLAGLYGYYFCWQTEDWRTAVSTIAKAMNPNDIVVVATPPSDLIIDVVGYYSPQLSNKLTFVGDRTAVERLIDASSGHRVWQIATGYHDSISEASMARALDRDHAISRSIPLNLISVTLWSPHD